GHGDVAAGARRVHEAAVAKVDADVVDPAATAEEHQVARGQLGAVHLLALARHVAGHARQLDAQGGAEHVADQATAIEAGGGGAAPAIRRAEQGQGLLEQALDAAGLRHGRGGVGDRSRVGGGGGGGGGLRRRGFADHGRGARRRGGHGGDGQHRLLRQRGQGGEGQAGGKDGARTGAADGGKAA